MYSKVNGGFVMKGKLVWILIFLIFMNFQMVTFTEASMFIQSEIKKYNIHESMEILEDKTGNITINEVSTNRFSKQFKLNDKGVPSYGYSKSVYWVRFELSNQSSNEEYTLEIPYAPHDSITLYEPYGSSKFNAFYGGDLLPFKERIRNHRYVTFDLIIPEKETKTYYVRFESEGSLQLQLLLWTEKAFTEKSTIEYLLLGLYCGITLAMIIYNLFLFFSLRLRSYLWYVLLIIGVSMTQLTLNGLAYQFIWPENPWWNNRSIVFFLAITNAAGALFVKKFLDVRNFAPILSRSINFLAIFNFGIIGVLMMQYTVALSLVMIATVLGIIVILTTNVICLKRGNTAARFLLLGWFIFLLFALLTAMSDAGLLPVNSFTTNATMAGAVVEMILFSLALADKMKMLQREKENVEKLALKNKELALEQMKRMDRMKDEFLANTTHELRTPLYGMIGIAESLRDGIAGEPNSILKDNLSLIINSGQRLSHLLNDLLDYSKLKNKEIHLDRGPVRLQDVASVVMTIIEPLTQNKDIELKNKIPSDFPYAFADENRVQQILYNLIGNAVKFTDSGSVTITAEKERKKLVVKIIDTGIGMDREDLQNAFNEFEQGSNIKVRQQSGTGLGLNITRDIVRLHGGEIFLTSEPGKGTTVSFTLPIFRESVREIEQRAIKPYYQNDNIHVSNTDSYRENHEIRGKILIADDDPINIQVLSNHLHLDGFQLVIAQDGEEVLSIIKKDTSFDLVILDLMMPKLSGYEVCKQLRKDFSLTDLPILILTAQSQLKDVVTAFQAGANDYLIKPYFKEELLARVKTLLTLKKVMEEVLEKSHELTELNAELFSLNDALEERVHERTRELEIKTGEVLSVEESRRHFLSNISHDLRTPLTAIQGYVSAMIDGLIEKNDQRYLDIIYEKTLFMDRLIKDLHDLSRLEAGQVSFYKEWVPIYEFIDHFLGGFEEDIVAHNIMFKLESHIAKQNEGLALYIDIDRIRQVMENLISNAIKYTVENGLIKIEVVLYDDFLEMHKDKQVYIEEISVAIENRFSHTHSLVIGVHDNGQGIDSESLPLIFKRYFRADSQYYETYRNAGLGLAIAKEIIDYHDGIIWAESIKRKGSSFYFTLPIYLEENAINRR